MIVVVTAVLVGIVVTILAFGYNLARLMGGHQGQETAIQSAALAAAHDLSRIVINTDDFGYVSLSDDAPIGKATPAGDNYFLPVRGINTLIATTRLDYIIGQQIGDPTLTDLAKDDFNTIKTKVLPVLKTTLINATKKGGSAKDIDGNVVKPYDDAELAFATNLKKTNSGASCDYVANSMNLTMGCLTEGVVTNLQIPQPTNLAQLNSNQYQNNCYLSDTDLAIAGIPFALAAVGPTVRLVDQTKWTLNNGLQTQIYAVVKAEADQTISNNQKANMVVHAIACAQPASVYDPRPAPGAFTVNYPDGPVQGFDQVRDIFAKGAFAKKTCTAMLKPTGGDFPTDSPPAAMIPTGAPAILGNPPTLGEACALSFYDWLRRAGTKANISAVVAMVDIKFNNSKAMKDWKTRLVVGGPIINLTKGYGISNAQIPVGTLNIFKWNPDGTIAYTTQESKPYPYLAMSENQFYAECLDCIKKGSINSVFDGLNAVIRQITSSTSTITLTDDWDVYIRDECRVQGTKNGGQHAGEPLDSTTTAYGLPKYVNYIALDAATLTAKTSSGAGGIGARPGPQPQTGNVLALGSIPILGNQSDFNELMANDTALYTDYPPAPGTPDVRPTYTVNGVVAEIRFRRQVQASQAIDDLLSGTVMKNNDTGYLAEEQ